LQEVSDREEVVARERKIPSSDERVFGLYYFCTKREEWYRIYMSFFLAVRFTFRLLSFLFFMLVPSFRLFISLLAFVLLFRGYSFISLMCFCSRNFSFSLSLFVRLFV